jgi:hypothetical protein
MDLVERSVHFIFAPERANSRCQSFVTVRRESVMSASLSTVSALQPLEVPKELLIDCV